MDIIGILVISMLVLVSILFFMSCRRVIKRDMSFVKFSAFAVIGLAIIGMIILSFDENLPGSMFRNLKIAVYGFLVFAVFYIVTHWAHSSRNKKSD